MDSPLETFVPLHFKRKKGKLLVDGRESAHDVRIVEAVARAMHWHALLDTGAFKSVVEIARAEGLMPTTVGRLLRLARLAPDIIEQLMQGWQRLLDEERAASVAEIAKAEGMDVTQVRRVMRLTLLAPEVIERLVGAPDIVLEQVMRRPWPNGWSDQIRMLAIGP